MSEFDHREITFKVKSVNDFEIKETLFKKALKVMESLFHQFYTFDPIYKM